MSDSVAEEPPRERRRRKGFAQTQLEREGLAFNADAPVTAAVASGTGAVAGFGDGRVRFFRPDQPPLTLQAHRGAVLCLAAEGGEGAVLTGGDDGRFLRLWPDGTVEEVASFGTRWVDCVAAGPGLYACSSGRNAYVWRAGERDPIALEHPSTVGGLDFDTKGRRVAVGHYGGATVWTYGKGRWNAAKLDWKGSHGSVSFSPDGDYVVTTMQESALHGWRLRDKADMRMSGYPAKVKSFAWVGKGPFLVTSGADEAICWPFFDKEGPLDRPPKTCAYGGKQLCTSVAGQVGFDGVFAGFADGSVLAADLSLDAEAKDLVIKGSSGAPVTALAFTHEGWLFVGEESGRILWVRLGGDSQ